MHLRYEPTIITLGVDPMLALGSVVAEELYGRSVPVVALDLDDYGRLRDGDRLAIFPDGTIELEHRGLSPT